MLQLLGLAVRRPQVVLGLAVKPLPSDAVLGLEPSAGGLNMFDTTFLCRRRLVAGRLTASLQPPPSCRAVGRVNQLLTAADCSAYLAAVTAAGVMAAAFLAQALAVVIPALYFILSVTVACVSFGGLSTVSVSFGGIPAVSVSFGGLSPVSVSFGVLFIRQLFRSVLSCSI